MAAEDNNPEMTDSVKTHINHLLSELESSETQVQNNWNFLYWSTRLPCHSVIEGKPPNFSLPLPLEAKPPGLLKSSLPPENDYRPWKTEIVCGKSDSSGSKSNTKP